MDDANRHKIARATHWTGSDSWDAPELPPIRASDVMPIAPDLDLWDCWPLQREDGSTAVIDGAQNWFFLSAPRLDDPGQRHVHARIRVMRRAGGEWTDLGNALPEDITPGSAEWAGSSVLHDDGRSITLFFTASGRRGEGPSFAQRIFGASGELVAGFGPSAWQEPQELFCADGNLFKPASSATGAPGTIKGFRDPAWFRDPANGPKYLLFTGSAGWSDDPHDGLVGYAVWNGDKWELGRPLIHAIGVNIELERPHVLYREGRYYLFWSTQRHTFSPRVTPGPNGLYCAVAERFAGPWQMVNGSGLVASNPAGEPTQAYSWWVTGDDEVWSFIDYWGMQGRTLTSHPELLRSRFGGSPAPTFDLVFDADQVRIANSG